MSFTPKQVEEAVEAFEEVNNDEYDGYSGVLSYLKSEGRWSHKGEVASVDVPGLGKLEYFEDYGGEGQGDDYWVVFKLGDQYFRKDGWYASYDGGELDGELYEVKPVEVKVTQYQQV